MPNKKLTDNEIKKALEWCEQITDNIITSNVKGTKFTFALQSLYTIKQVLKDYNRLQAENERLQSINDSFTDIGKLYSEIKAEAYKECIEKVKEKITEALKSNYKARSERIAKVEVGSADEFIAYCEGKIHCLRGLDDFLDNLLKELVGEDNA